MTEGGQMSHEGEFGPPESGRWSFYRYFPARVPGLAPLDHIRRLIVESTIYFPRASQFKDPLDCRPTIRMPTTDEIEEYRRRRAEKIREKTLEWGQDAWRVIRSRLTNWEWLGKKAELDRQQCVVLSLTEMRDSLFHWETYASRGTGVCAHFDLAVALERDAPEWVPLPVHYQETPAIIGAIDGLITENPTEAQLELFYRAHFLTKLAAYRAEAEARLTVWEPNIARDQYRQVPANMLCGISPGPRMAPRDKIQVEAWCLEAGVALMGDGSSP
jgi:hypothetical protein